MDRTGGMENAHDTLAPECTGPEARFPHRLGRHRTPPIRSTGTLVCTLEHDVTGRISSTRCETDGRKLTEQRRYAPTSVHVRRNPCSRSPESGVHVHRITQRDKRIEQQDREISRLRGELARATRDRDRWKRRSERLKKQLDEARRARPPTRQPPLPRTGRKVAAGIPDGGLAHATVGRAAARARDRSTRPSRRRCRRRVRTAAARLT